jgi:hypothetical protein
MLQVLAAGVGLTAQRLDAHSPHQRVTCLRPTSTPCSRSRSRSMRLPAYACSRCNRSMRLISASSASGIATGRQYTEPRLMSSNSANRQRSPCHQTPAWLYFRSVSASHRLPGASANHIESRQMAAIASRRSLGCASNAPDGCERLAGGCACRRKPALRQVVSQSAIALHRAQGDSGKGVVDARQGSDRTMEGVRVLGRHSEVGFPCHRAAALNRLPTADESFKIGMARRRLMHRIGLTFWIYRCHETDRSALHGSDS